MKHITKPDPARPTRNHEQSMGIWINEPMVLEPASIDRAVAKLADAGFGMVRLFLRNSNFNYRSPEFVSLVERGVRKAHERGLLAMLDCEPHAIACTEMGQQFPGDMGGLLVRADCQVTDGHWLLQVDTPRPGSGTPIFEAIEAAYLCVNGVSQRVELDFTVCCEISQYKNGGIHREMNHVGGLPISTSKVIKLRGEIPGVAEGRLVAYYRFSSRSLPDFWSEGFKAYYADLLECYRHIPLDGVGWDEPAGAGDWNSYQYGKAFAQAFERINGYKLSDKLDLLDEPGMSGEAAKVRLDYYRTLNEGVAQAQAQFNAKAVEVFGKPLISGTHHTWQGEGGINDYRAGAVDYFRLNDNMDAGYTDCCWWDPASVAYAYTLGSSLGRLTPSGEAEVNTWHFKPTVTNTLINVNLMSLMNINWFNIWFGSDTDTSMMDGHYSWPQSVKSMRTHQKLQLAIGGRKPVIDVAIWHGWEGVCAWNTTGLANVQKAFCLNTSHFLIKRSISADFIDSRLLEESQVEQGRLINALGAYRILVIPYALALPRKAFEMCLEFAKAGGKLVFVGTPVAFDEFGNSLASDFAKLLQMPEMSAEHYVRGIACTLPESGRPARLEACRPLASDLPHKLVSIEGEIHGVKAGNVVFLTDLDPQQRLIDQIADVRDLTVRAHGDNLLWRLYRDESGDSLVIVSADDRPVGGVVFWGELVLEILGGFSGVFTLDASGAPIQEGDIAWKVLMR